MRRAYEQVIGSRVEAAANRNLPAMTGLQVVAATAVIVIGMRQRPHDGEQVGDVGQPMQFFTDLQTGGSRRDRLEMAADFLRSLGFQIERFVLAGAAEQK